MTNTLDSLFDEVREHCTRHGLRPSGSDVMELAVGDGVLAVQTLVDNDAVGLWSVTVLATSETGVEWRRARHHMVELFDPEPEAAAQLLDWLDDMLVAGAGWLRPREV